MHRPFTLESTLEEMAQFEECFTDETRRQLELTAQGETVALNRRLALLVCARDMETLGNLSIQEPEIYAQMLDCVENFAEHARVLHELADLASIRMNLADGRRGQE